MVDIVDLRIEMKNRMNRGAISLQLAQAMKVTLTASGQVILLLNRREVFDSCAMPFVRQHSALSSLRHRDDVPSSG